MPVAKLFANQKLFIWDNLLINRLEFEKTLIRDKLFVV